MKIIPLTPDNEICFFGYYDKKQLSPDNKYCLFLKVDFQNRSPKENDKAEIFVGDIENKKFEKIDETYAWNFQQGCMLSWLSNEEIIYNIRIGKDFYSKIYNIKNGKFKIVERPVSCVYPEKRIALSLNFSRLAKWRPGYGYEGGIDKYENEKWPEKDGIHFVDLNTGKHGLVVSLSRMLEFRKEKEIRNSYAWFNHTLFNRDGTRFCSVNRWKEKLEDRHKTRFITSDIEGRMVYDLIDSYLISHFDWKDEKEMAVWAEIEKEYGFWLIEDKTGRYKKINENIQRIDGHCSFSKDRRLILYDTYPVENYKYLRIYDVEKRSETIVEKFRSIFHINATPFRCDLHPRWENSNTITIDSVNEGYRRSYLINIDNLNAGLLTRPKK